LTKKKLACGKISWGLIQVEKMTGLSSYPAVNHCTELPVTQIALNKSATGRFLPNWAVMNHSSKKIETWSYNCYPMVFAALLDCLHSTTKTGVNIMMPKAHINSLQF
jgi:hypothetical protein